MSEGSRVKEISLGDDFGDVVVKANGARVEIHSDGGVDAYTDRPVKVHANAHDGSPAESLAALAEGWRTAFCHFKEIAVWLRTPGAQVAKTEPGDEMPDGTIYAGISPDTHKPMYARPKDESGAYSFKEAAKHATNIGDGFHVPTKNELKVLYENRNKGKLKGTFNETGAYPAGWYWSSKPYSFNNVWAQRFRDGYQNDIYRYNDSSLRLVR